MGQFTETIQTRTKNKMKQLRPLENSSVDFCYGVFIKTSQKTNQYLNLDGELFRLVVRQRVAFASQSSSKIFPPALLGKRYRYLRTNNSVSAPFKMLSVSEAQFQHAIKLVKYEIITNAHSHFEAHILKTIYQDLGFFRPCSFFFFQLFIS